MVGVVPRRHLWVLVDRGGGSSWPVGHRRCSSMVVLGARGHSWSWPFINSGGGPSLPFMGTCRLWWWVLVASGPSSLFVDGGVGCPWTFVGSCCHSSIMVVDPRSQLLMVMVGARCVSWGLPEESVVVTCDIVFVTSPNWDVSNSVAFLSFVTLCQG